MKRRSFIKSTSHVGIGLSILPTITAFGENVHIEKRLPRRILGKTGENLSIIGFGGIMVRNTTTMEAANYVAQAIELGVNYFDVAPTYGNAEEMLGPALKPYRNNNFLACKTKERTKEGAEKEFHESLKKLHTDYFDLYQLHALTTMDDIKTALGPGGAMEFLVKAKQEGKIKYIGFSAHNEEVALYAMNNYDFDTILYPVNYVIWNVGNFGQKAVELAKEKQMGILALKALALTRIPQGEQKPYEKLWYVPIEDKRLTELSLKYTLSQGTTAAIPPGDIQFYWNAIERGTHFEEITQTEIKELAYLTKGVEPLFKA
jgi:predicted aldo/keto reductase-like oxidoreductase